MGQGCGSGFELTSTSFLSSEEGGLGDSETPISFAPAGSSGLRMLSVREYDNSVQALLGESESLGAQELPEDALAPFDNAAENMMVSEARIRSLESVADTIVSRFLEDGERMVRHLPCVPEEVTDEACFRQIVGQVGRLAFRRPLSEEEKGRFLSLTTDFAQQSQSVNGGLEVFLKFILQHPSFLYRWEVGELINRHEGVYKLNDFELASRLAFTLWGAPPDLALLEAAEEGRLSDTGSFRQLVDQMLEDERTLRQIDFFHSAWFGYSGLGGQTNLTQQMREETQALLRRIVFEENRPWRDVLTFDETYVTRELAAHYGITSPNEDSGWVPYGSSERRGLFSHGSFLAVGGKFGDTSPVQRGYMIRKQVFCEDIPPPPPGIDADDPVQADISSPCKEDHHRASTLAPGTSCVGCHQSIDTIGFGLERYDALGGFRTQEYEHPQCQISGNGEVLGYGIFNGPGELGKIAAESGRVEHCLVERWVQLSFGRETDENGEQVIQRYVHQFQQSGSLKDWVRDFVASADFRYRRPLERGE